MKTASDLAEWWDKNKKDSEKIMMDFVLDNPDYWVVGALAGTAMDVGAMYVDVLRLGEGAAEGTAKGYIQDLFRAITIASAAGKGLGKAATYLANMRLFADTGGPACALYASANAIRRTGQRIMISLDDVAQAHGFDGLAKFLSNASGLSLTQTVAAFRKLGIALRGLGKAGSIEDVMLNAARNEGIVMARVKTVAGEGHRILFQRIGGVVKIVDRSGIYDDLQALNKAYKRLFAIDPMAEHYLIPNATWKILPDGLGTVMLYVTTMLDMDPDVSVEEVDKAFQQYKVTKGAASPAGPAGKFVDVVRGTTLSGISKSEYNTFDYWPLLWDANKGAIGDNPNRLKIGQRLSVPPLASFNAAQLQDAKKRAPTWRNYPS